MNSGLINKSETCGQMIDRSDRTVLENIDAKIEHHRREIERLEASKATLGPLLGMRIADIREAMMF